MKLTEKIMWQRMRAADDDGIMRRIETGDTGRGVSDVTYCANHRTGWVELKVSPKPFWQEQPVRLQQPFKIEQLAWLLRHDTDEHPYLRSYIIVGTLDEHEPNRISYLMMRAHAARLLVHGASPTPLRDLLLLPGSVIYDNAAAIVRRLTSP